MKTEEDFDDNRINKLLNMFFKRKHVNRPDVDEEWDKFRHEHMDRRGIKAKRFAFKHLIAAGCVGAAASFLILFFIQTKFAKTDKISVKSDYIALQHDNNNQQLTLEENGNRVEIENKDSISFLNAKVLDIKTKIEENSIKTHRLSTPRGMDIKVTLPDGSEVWLNAESSIEFPSAFHSGLREVKLSGEAYFKIVRDINSPFIVTSPQMKVKVLGTEFNFRSYLCETAHVALITGKIEVMRKDVNSPDAILKPGEEAWYDDNGAVQVGEVDTYAATQWVNGFFYFHNQPLVDVLRELGRWYNLGVVFKNKDVYNYNIHFSAVRNDKIDVAIESLNRLRRVKIKIDDKNIVVY